MKKMLILLVLALGAAFVPAGAGPVVARVSVSQFGYLWAYRTLQIGPNQLSYDSWNINIYTNRKADNAANVPATSETYTADVQYFGCQNNCTTQTNWYANTQTLPANAFQVDPLGNSATLQMTLVDNLSQSHTFSLTITRPQNSWENHGVPNAWADGASAGVGVPYLAFSRSGYVINGTIDNGQLLNTPGGPCNGLCGGSNGNVTQSLDSASVTAN